MAQQRDPIFAASRAGRVADQEIVPQARAQLLPYISADAVAEVDDARRLQGLNESARERRALWALTLVQTLFDVSAWGGLKRDRKSYVSGKSVSVRVVLGGRRTIKSHNSSIFNAFYELITLTITI